MLTFYISSISQSDESSNHNRTCYPLPNPCPHNKSIFSLFQLLHNMSDNIKRDVLDLETASIHLFLFLFSFFKCFKSACRFMNEIRLILCNFPFQIIHPLTLSALKLFFCVARPGINIIIYCLRTRNQQIILLL